MKQRTLAMMNANRLFTTGASNRFFIPLATIRLAKINEVVPPLVET